EASMRFVEQPLVTPLQLSTGVIERITQASATVTVEVAGRRATGAGCIYLSDLWAWPDLNLSHAQRDEALRDLATDLARQLPERLGEPAHPLELGLRLHDAADHVPATLDPPPLAR